MFLWVASADIACLSVDDGLFRCIICVLRVSSFNGLYSAPGPFLLTLTTINVDMYLHVYTNLCSLVIKHYYLCKQDRYVEYSALHIIHSL